MFGTLDMQVGILRKWAAVAVAASILTWCGNIAIAQQGETSAPATEQAGQPQPSAAGWRRSCQGEAGSATEQCVIQQQVAVGNQVIMVGAFGMRGPDKRALGVITVPLGVLLKAGLSLRVDANEQFGVPFEYCTRQGCRVEFELTADLQKSLEAGNLFQVGWRLADGNNAVLKFSLAGFKSAWGSIAGGQ